ncbi:uncharacterized protein LOC130446785 [Diorhabda sublineata]|uniref:uncharacterized protein LOC130446785 n=1 Tax=Diorhabda sublineata TaxID=1163346 RepID=UPI0024E0AB5A|nr:uncharacterized protein LOC130446785 [Diorhabda sublineata]
MTKLKVAVRVRPLSDRETEIESVPVISVLNDESLEITNIKVTEQNVGDSRERIRRFTFDYCFHENCSQNYIFERIERIINQSMKQRKHSCVLAYGQSSTGKTHTMMGIPRDPGLIPSFCEKIFDYLQEMATGEEAFDMKVTVSYLEIYNEKVRDLLNSANEAKKTSLKIREHPKKGPYVQGLSEQLVKTSSDLHYWLEEGNKHRKIAATHSNPQSSRSHSVFVINCDGVKLNLIDLAGSERAANRCFNISRFKEGSSINKSIVALGNVISALADQTLKQARGIRRRFVPYRDSVLTWLLKDILGGNSNTVMVATVSPSSICYNETVNTLRFGQRAKNIIFRPVVHEDPKEKTIRELRAEIFKLKELLKTLQLPCLNQMYFQKDINRDTKDDVLPKTHLNPTNCVLSLLTDKLDAVEGPLFANEELIPVIDVETKVEQKESRAIFMMSTNKIDCEKRGSNDSIVSSKSVASNQSSEQDSSRRSSLRTESSPKSVSAHSRASSKKQSPKTTSNENLSKKSESKINSGSKNSARSQVVAAVTSRLYNKVKKKEVATDTDDINTYNLSVIPAELMIAENARARLRNITRRALRANRVKNQDIQTDFSPIVRIKEASTHTSDLKIYLEEIKNVETMTSTINSIDACVDCSDLINTVTDTDTVKNLLITRSCGTQFSKEDSQKKHIVPKPSTLISFTKYLKGTKENVATDAIYTNVVNINISNNYVQGDKPSDSVSSDSLDHYESQSAYMVTPDLLSNHPPLETSSKEVQTWYHGSVVELQDEFSETVEYANEDTTKVYNKAKCSLIPTHSVAVPSIKMLKGHLAETHRTAGQEEEFCLPLKEFKVVPAKPKIIHSSENDFDDTVIVNEPRVLQHVNESKENIETLKNPGTIRSGLSKKILPCERGDAQRMVSAMSAFLEEATDMMSKLSEKVEEPRAYDMQITVSGLKTCRSLTKKKKSVRSVECEKEKSIKQDDQQTENKKCFKDQSSQTILPFTYNCSTQFDIRDIPSLPINKYEIPFEAACSQLEKTLSLVHDPRELSIGSDVLDVDMDTAPCFSDYGSLPKMQKKKYRTWSMTPRSYLKQLTAMRKDIVECSRDYMKSFSEHVKSSGDHVNYNHEISDRDFIKNDT